MMLRLTQLALVVAVVASCSILFLEIGLFAGTVGAARVRGSASAVRSWAPADDAVAAGVERANASRCCAHTGSCIGRHP